MPVSGPRIVADDLTGALDAAGPFATPEAPLPVLWTRDVLPAGSFAFDAGTRDLPPSEAHRLALRDAALLRGAGLAFRKLDSRLRGHPLAEIMASAEAGGFRTVIIAPAFPGQGRITRGGRQLARVDGTFRDCGVDLASLPGCRVIPAGTTPEGSGLLVGDAECQRDLARIAAGSYASPVLWCGSAGLGRALAGASPALPAAWVQPPVLLLIGSDQPVAAAQRRMAEQARIVTRGLELPPGTTRDAARTALHALCAEVARLPPPGTLLVAGGETLLSLCRALGTSALMVEGELMPGIPASSMVGGSWDGVRVVSKSGGFGGATVWVDLLEQAGKP